MTRYLSLAEYLWLAEQVTEIDVSVLVKAARVDLADSALHAPQAGFGEEDFYPDILDKAAVLTCRLAWNHPLPDGNKRAAWASLVMFVDLNGARCRLGRPVVGMRVGMAHRADVDKSPTSGVYLDDASRKALAQDGDHR